MLGFFVGCLVHAAYRRGWRLPRFALPAILFAIVGFLCLDGRWKPVLTMIPFTALLILAVVSAPGDGVSWLKGRAVRALGSISYSLYMSHMFALWVVTQILRVLLKFPMETTKAGTFPLVTLPVAFALYPVTILVCLASGALIYRWVEAPSIIWMKRLAGRETKVA